MKWDEGIIVLNKALIRNWGLGGFGHAEDFDIC